MYKPHEICVALRAYRVKARLKQDVVAGMLDVAQSQISRWESGRDMPRPHNIEAIKALLWGEVVTPRQSLQHFVAGSSLPLMLFDHEHRPLAAGLPFQQPGSELHRFGWAFDPQSNATFAPVYAQYRAVLANPSGLVGLELKVPFEQDGTRWLGTARKTIYALEGAGVCLAEISFAPANGGLVAPTLKRIDPPAAPAERVELRALAQLGAW